MFSTSCLWPAWWRSWTPPSTAYTRKTRKRRERRKRPERRTWRRRDDELTGERPLQDGRLPHELVRFSHNSERQFAKLLDFYGVEWEYEPTEFALEWDRKGKPSLAFRPDFYLPAYDLYIEITTLNQKLVTKKNRKLRRLRELHPELKVKMLYQRDYVNLLVKYGLEEPSQLAADQLDLVEPMPLSLDGTELQPPRR